jgi:hypothetical protein
MLRRLRPADYAVGICGLVLLCSLFAPWYEITDGTSDGWRSLRFIDMWLLIVALLAMSIPLVTAAKDAPAVPVALTVITAWLTLVAIIVVVYRVADPASPAGETADARAWGLWLALIAVLGTFAAAWWAMRTEHAPGLRPPPEVRAMPVPPVSDPASPPT